MKKLMTAVALCAYFLVSCEQQDENIAPERRNIETEEVALTHFDESNSQAIPWEAFPEELKNAIPLDTEQSESEHARTAYSTYSYAVGPWGGNGGTPFYIYPPSGSRIHAIAIRAGGVVDRLTVWYKTSDGTIYIGVDKGGNGGDYYLQYFSNDEYIRSISGRSGAYIDYLRIVTNRKSFGYGGWGGTPFSVSTLPYGYQILGFYGRSAGVLDKIGFYVYTL